MGSSMCIATSCPGIDAGAPDVGAALELAGSAAASGVRVIAATPHVRADHPRVRPSELGERCDALRERLLEAEIGVEVVAGGEVDLAWSRGASDEELTLVSYGQRGRDLLVERRTVRWSTRSSAISMRCGAAAIACCWRIRSEARICAPIVTGSNGSSMTACWCSSPRVRCCRPTMCSTTSPSG